VTVALTATVVALVATIVALAALTEQAPADVAPPTVALPPLPAPLPTEPTAPAPRKPEATESSASSASSAQAQPAAQPQGAAGSFSMTETRQLAGALVKQVNRVRRNRGLRALTVVPALRRAAEAHAQTLAVGGLFTHSWNDGRPFSTWILGFYSPRGYRHWAAGENLLWAAPSFSPVSAAGQWLASPTHRRIMLGRAWRHIGIAVVTARAAPGVYGGLDVQIAAAEFGSRTR
jgi:uncharacterized protein YkwD